MGQTTFPASSCFHPMIWRNDAAAALFRDMKLRVREERS